MGSSWHYQVIRHKQGDEEWYGVHEYYEFENTKVSWSITPVLTADTLEDLKQDLKRIEQDIYRYGVKDYEV